MAPGGAGEKKMQPTKFIIKSSKAKMPGTCWGVYARIAVLEVDADVDTVSMISERARGVHRIVRTWESLNVGTTDRCAYARALAVAEELADRLNEEAQAECSRRFWNFD